MKQLQTFNPKNQAVAFGYRKKPKITLEDIVERLDKIETRLTNIETRLDNVVKLNNLKE